MSEFHQGDKVELYIKGNLKGVGIVNEVGATCLYCIDDYGHQFHSHKENFVLAKNQSIAASIDQTRRAEKKIWDSAIESAADIVEIEIRMERIKPKNCVGVLSRVMERILELKHES